MLYKWIRDDVAKLSYVDRVEFKGSTFYIHYLKNGWQKCKKLPYRADKNKLIDTLNAIKKDIDYTTIQKKRLKKLNTPSVVHFPGISAGEIDGKRDENSSG